MEQRDRVCDICGNIGYVEDLVSCCQCKNAYEHIYCMEKLSLAVPQVWFCGQCQAHGQPVQDREVQGAYMEEESVNVRGSESELTEALEKTYIPSDRGQCQAHGQPVQDRKVQVAYIEEESVDVRGSESEMTKDLEKTNIPSDRGRCAEQIYGNRKKLGRSGKHAIRLSRSTAIEIKKQNPPRTAYLPVNEAVMMTPGHSHFKAPKSADRTPGKTFRRSVAPDSMLPRASTQKAVPVLPELPKPSAPDKVPKVVNKEIANSNSIRGGFGMASLPGLQHKLIESDEKCTRRPVPELCWKGSFDFFEIVAHHYGGIQAHVPYGQVPLKVYETSQQLPDSLKFNILPRTRVWPKLFGKDPPTSDDVGLYFLPAEDERHREKYFRLSDRLDSRDYALKCCLGDTELLVFASNQLLENGGKWTYVTGISNSKYLWGVFRRVKCKVTEQKPGQAPPLLAVASVDNMNSPLMGGSEQIDMEVDMVGGLEFDRIDRPISRINTPPSYPKTVSSDAYSGRLPVKFTLTKKSSQILPDIPPGFSRPLRLKNGGNSSYAKHNGPVFVRDERKGSIPFPARDGQTSKKSEVRESPKSPEIQSEMKKRKTSEGNTELDERSKQQSPTYASSDRPSNKPEGLLSSAGQKSQKVVEATKIAVSDGLPLVARTKEKGKLENQNGMNSTNEQSCMFFMGYNNSSSSFEKQGPSLDSTLPLFPQAAASLGNEFELSTTRKDRQPNTVQSFLGVSPNLSLSRPHYVRDGNVWIPATST